MSTNVIEEQGKSTSQNFLQVITTQATFAIAICFEMGLRCLFTGIFLGAICGTMLYIVMMPYGTVLGILTGTVIGLLTGIVITVEILCFEGKAQSRLCQNIAAITGMIIGTIGTLLVFLINLNPKWQSYTIFEIFGSLIHGLEDGGISFFLAPALVAGWLTAWHSYRVADRAIADRDANTSSQDFWQEKVNKWRRDTRAYTVKNELLSSE